MFRLRTRAKKMIDTKEFLGIGKNKKIVERIFERRR